MTLRLALGLALVSAITPACAHADVFSGDQLRGTLDVRTGVADGERSWLRGGFGKTRFSGAGNDFADRDIARGMLIWRPHLTWSLDGYVSLQADSQAHPAVDVVEAFVSYRGAPTNGWRFSGRAGLMYPPVSLENTGPGWTPAETITPSAINSWIGEEVKVLGGEATARHAFGEQQLAATIGVFGFNDTAGTLLADRGWAMGDVLVGARGELALPRRSYVYQDYTKPTTELDDRLGYYARLEYRPIGPVTLDITHYDNAGDRRSDNDGQTDWQTEFTDIGLRAALDAHTRLLAQAMTGRTVWGQNTPLGYWVDLDFSAAYLLLAHDIGNRSIAGRVDYFKTTDNSYQATNNNDEEGWAATLAYQITLSPATRLAFEALHMSSDRPTRTDQGLAAEQRQTTLQSAFRFSF